MKDRLDKKKKIIFFLLLLVFPMFTCQIRSLALEDSQVIKILSSNPGLFHKNGIVAGAFRFIGWGITKGIAALADVCAGLYDTCFGFIDFTKYTPVKTFIDQWKPFFISLVCLSILLIGILLCIGWEKKPKIVINLLIAVTVVSSSTYAINTMNKLISKEVRSEILGGEQSSAVVYSAIGNNIHDLKWLNKTVGLANLNKKTKGKKNADKVYDSFSKSQFKNLDIQEILDPDDFDGDTEDILKNGLHSESDDKNHITYSLDELYDGVAWTDLLNEFYYRYTVDYGVMWMELISLIIIYLFMSYKVIRILYEIVIHRLLAYLYSANLNNNQKILKILDSLKDSYILLLFTTVIIKIYLLATKFISEWNVSGIAKGIILLFLAFAVIDGPNLIQKLTGADIGASDGMGKMMSLFYSGRMAASTVGAAAGAVKSGVGAVKNGASRVLSKPNVKEAFSGNSAMDEQAQDMVDAGAATASADNVLNQQNNQSNDNNMDNNMDNKNKSTNHLNQNNNANNNNHVDVWESTEKEVTNSRSGEVTDSQTPESGNKQKENVESSRVGSASPNSVVTMSSEQGKKGGGYHQMDQIGHNQTRNDALNGVNSGGNAGIGSDSMKQMEKDLSNSRTGTSLDSTNNIADNKPLESGGHMFDRISGSEGSTVDKNNETRELRSKDIFGDNNAGRIN